MKLRKALVAGVLAVSALTSAVAPVMAAPTQFAYDHKTTITDNLGDANVKLSTIEINKNADYNSYNKYGYVLHEFHMTFLVRNCGYDKHIVLHYQTIEGDWRDSQTAQYVKTLADGTEVWEMDFVGNEGSQYCVHYKEVDAWDNNNNNNYMF